jgi:hypothetical protein
MRQFMSVGGDGICKQTTLRQSSGSSPKSTGFAMGTQFILGQINVTLQWQRICEVMERQRNECTTCGRFMSICRISKGGNNLFVFVGGVS